MLPMNMYAHTHIQREGGVEKMRGKKIYRKIYNETGQCSEYFMLIEFLFLNINLIILFIFLNFILFFLNFTILYWFCQILKWIRHRYTCVPHPEPSSLLPPHTIPLGHPRVPAPSIHYRASNLDWRLVPYMILYIFILTGG